VPRLLRPSRRLRGGVLPTRFEGICGIRNSGAHVSQAGAFT
jgi:hypothetical protein